MQFRNLITSDCQVHWLYVGAATSPWITRRPWCSLGCRIGRISVNRHIIATKQTSLMDSCLFPLSNNETSSNDCPMNKEFLSIPYQCVCSNFPDVLISWKYPIKTIALTMQKVSKTHEFSIMSKWQRTSIIQYHTRVTFSILKTYIFELRYTKK